MKTKGLETWLYSTLGVVAMLAILVGINLLGSRAKVRVDLTADHAYTLSEGTKAILGKIDTPVQIRLYCSRSDNAMPIAFKAYAQRVEDMLAEFRQLSKGQIDIQKLDPAPGSDAEDSANMDGIEPQPAMNGERFYLGASVTMLDQKETIPYLSPLTESKLEYDFARAISRVANPTKPVLGVMSALPVNGFNNPMMQRSGRRPQREWAILQELRRDFTVRTVEMTADKIPDEVQTLIVIHPQDIRDEAQYAIDQFVLRGGKLIAFLDPLSYVQAASSGGQMGGNNSSSMDKLLKAWGLSFDSTKVVADTTYALEQGGGRHLPVFLDLTGDGINGEDNLTAGTERLVLLFAGAFSGTPAEGLKETVLLKSSTNSELVDPMLAQIGQDQMMKNLKVSGVEQTLAVRLRGKFKTAFPDGKPKPITPEEKPDEKKPAPPAEPSLKESKQETTVLLFGDSDCLYDEVVLTRLPDGSLTFTPNGAFAFNAVDQMAGDNNLVDVRSRASRERPFTVVKKIEADARASYQSKLQEVEKTQTDTVSKLNQLLSSSSAQSGKRVVLPPDVRNQIDELRKKQVEVEKEKRLLVRKMNADIDSLKTQTTWMNLLVMPCFVAFTGLILALLRRRAHAAR